MRILARMNSTESRKTVSMINEIVSESLCSMYIMNFQPYSQVTIDACTGIKDLTKPCVNKTNNCIIFFFFINTIART